MDCSMLHSAMEQLLERAVSLVAKGSLMPYVARSANFGHLASFDVLFDQLGSDLECLVHSHPGLAMVLARQLAEVLATATIDLRGMPVPACRPDGSRLQLFDFLQVIGNSPDNTGLRTRLEQLRVNGNDYTHVRFGRPYAPPVDMARKSLRLAYDAGCWFQKTFGDSNRIPEFRMPQSGAPFKQPAFGQAEQADLFTELEAELDNCEHIVDTTRGLGGKEEEAIRSLRQRIEAPANRRRLESWQPGYLLLRLESIVLAGRCHRGEQPDGDDLPTKTQQLVEAVVGDPQANGIDQAYLYHNRWMILQSNGYRFEKTYDRLLGLADSQRERARITANQLGVPFVPDQQLGRLLGSLGQLTAMTAWEIKEWSMLNEAAKCFDEARLHFTESADTSRQDTYWGHVIAEQLRFNPPSRLIDTEESRWTSLYRALADDIQAVTEKPLNGGTRGRTFGTALRLKLDYLMNHEPPQLRRLVASLLEHVDTRLSDSQWHPDSPYEQISGLLGMHLLRMGQRVPEGLRLTLERIARAPSLSGFIATVYQAQWAFMRDDGDIVAKLKADLGTAGNGWPDGRATELIERLGTFCNQGGPGPWSLLPFNFA